MEEELSIFDIVRILMNQWILILLLMVIGGGGTFFICTKITPWYGYSSLVRVPAYKILGPDFAGGAASALLGKSTSTAKDTKAEITTYLDYNYINDPKIKEDKNKTRYLKKIDPMGDTEFMEIIGYGRSQDEAKEMTQEVVGQIRKLFKDRVDAAINQKKETLDFMNYATSKLNEQMAFVEKGLKAFGVQANLLAEKSAIQGKLLDAEKERRFYEAKTGEDVIRPLTIVSEREVSYLEPAFPKPLLFSVVGTLLGLLLGSFYAIFSAFMDRENNFDDSDESGPNTSLGRAA